MVKLNSLEEKVMQLRLDGVSNSEIRRICDIPNTRLYKIIRKLKDYDLIPNRQFVKKCKPKHEPKNYSWINSNQHYQIMHSGVYYGCVKTEEQAKRFVELMRYYDWDKSMAGKCKRIAVGGY